MAHYRDLVQNQKGLVREWCDSTPVTLATEGGMNSCGASPREEQDNRLCVGCYYILDHSLSGLFILEKRGF